MRIERRLRYYCDHCKKSGGQAAAMISHESACTKNPDRVCKMCEIWDEGAERPGLAELMAVLPDPAQYMRVVEWLQEPVLDDDAITSALDDAIKKLRVLADGCPMCMLAALRQRKIPVPLARSFDYAKERVARWADIKEAEKVTQEFRDDYYR